MKQIADLHIHSRYSMATSKDGTPEMLDLWARKKGITVLGTGDMTHPVWRQELKEKLGSGRTGIVPPEGRVCFAGGGTLSRNCAKICAVG